jgi:LmbE family N-acetylglucosaminyl deacetylase
MNPDSEKQYTKLIISPHIDDEILGCGGILDDKTFVLECGVDKFHVVSRKKRIEELEKAKELLGFDFEILTNLVNNYEVAVLIDQLSDTINRIKPEKVFIPYPSYNQDHQAVYKAALIALRPHDINFFVKKVLVYEQPHVFLWDYSYDKDSTFKPNYFIPIDILKKIEAYKCIKSQVRSFRHPDFVKDLASVRGKQAQCSFAEAYEVLRWVE